MATPLHNVPYTPKNTKAAPGSPAHGTDITKSDDTIYDPPLTQIWIGGTGDLTVLLAGDDTPIAITGVPANIMLSLCIKKVMAATTATKMLGFW